MSSGSRSYSASTTATSSSVGSSSSLASSYVPTVSYSKGPNFEGLGMFFVIMLMVIGLPLVVLTPLAIIFAPLFFIGCVVCLLIGCLKG